MLALCFSTSVQAQGVPSRADARFVSQDLKALSLYFEGMALLEEGQTGKPFKLFNKAKTRLEKRLNSGQLNSADVAVLFNIARVTGNSEEILRLGQFRLFLGDDFVDEELISVCAQTAYGIGNFEFALSFLKAGDGMLQPNLDRSLAISEIYLKMGEVDSALHTIGALFGNPSFEIEAGIRYAKLLNEVGLENESYIALQLLNELFPEALGVKLARAKYLQLVDQEEEALEAFKGIFENRSFTNESIAEELAKMANELVDSKWPRDHPSWAYVIDLSHFAAETRHESALLKRTEADALYSCGFKTEALASYKASLIRPLGKSWEVFETIASVALEINDLKGYLAIAFEANEAFPDHERAPIMLGMALMLNDQPQQAIKTFQLGLKRSQAYFGGNSPMVPEYLFRLGSAYFHVDDVKNMSAAMDLLLTYMPDYAQAKNNYAYYLSHFNVRLGDAIALVNGALEIEPESPEYWDTKAFVLMQQGKWTKASKAISECLAFGGAQNSVACLHAAVIYSQLKQKEKMESFLKKALDNGATQFEMEAVRRQMNQELFLEKKQ